MCQPYAYLSDGSNIKIVTYIPYYNSLKDLQRLIPSLELDDPYSTDLVIAGDGVYEGFKYKNRPTPTLSDDGSREYLHQFGKVLMFDVPGYQNVKRQKLVDLACSHYADFLLILDTDEFLHPEFRDWKKFRRKLVECVDRFDPDRRGICINIPLWIDRDWEKAHNEFKEDAWMINPRIWHRPECLEYYNGVHYWVRRRNQSSKAEQIGKVASTSITIYDGIRLVTDSKMRDREHLDARDKWAAWGIEKEKKLIETFNLFNGVMPADMIAAINNGVRMVNPLLCITQPREIPQVIEAIEKLDFVDKLWIKYYDGVHAYDKMREIFLQHLYYTHLVILPDDLLVTREDYAMLHNDIVKNDYPVLSGWCNLTKEGDNSKLSNICIDKIPRHKPPRALYLDEFKWASIKELKAMVDEEGWRVIDVKFAGFPLTFIRRDVVEKIKFRDDYGCCHDTTFGLDLEDAGIPQFCDLRVGMQHLKIDEGKYEKMQVGIKKPEIKWEYRTKTE